jgi:hypothetical protein
MSKFRSEQLSQPLSLSGSFTGSFTGNGLGLINLNTASLNGFYGYTASLNTRITTADNKTGSYAVLSAVNDFVETNTMRELVVGHISGSNGTLSMLNNLGETKFVFGNNLFTILGDILQTEGGSSFTTASIMEASITRSSLTTASISDFKANNLGFSPICGTDTLAAGSKTVATNKVTNNSIIIVTKKTNGTPIVYGDHPLTVDTISEYTSFTVNSNGSNAESDSDPFSWLIINPI